MGKYGPDKNPYLDTSHIVLETIDLRENSRNFYEGISSGYFRCRLHILNLVIV